MKLNLLFFFLGTVFSLSARAQILPIGLSEGFMGNSGTAIVDSTAPSFYNPSLLGDKQNDSFTISGTSFSNITSQSDHTQYSALSIAPSYLSTIHTGESVNHELFFINQGSGNFRLLGNYGDSTPSTSVNSNLNMNQDLMGYSLAFRSFPFAMQFAFHYLEASQLGYTNYSDPSNNTYTNGQLDSEYKKLDFAMGLSTHVRFQSYTFAVNYISRGVQLYKTNRINNKFITNSNGTYSEATTHEGGVSFDSLGQTLRIGHGFRNGAHEFLTDTNLAENGSQLNTYTTTQSFGYRYVSASQRQFFCGLNHEINPRITYFGQNLYVSTGFSWVSNGLRSSMGIFYYNDNLDTKLTAYGINFASEFTY